ncbi:MAG: hypothetical protein MJY88_08500 [Bacteroidales bacterium]|nr:hypothetical protein [Bacteroidales bacterium]
MKKYLFSIAAIIAAAVSCQKVESPTTETKTVEFFAESIETKTVFGEGTGTPVKYPTLWTSDSKVKVNLNASISAKDAAVIPSEDFKTAKISASVTDDGSGSYVFRALSPAAAFDSYSSSGWSIKVPVTQTPTTASVDEVSQILVAETDAMDSFPTTPVSLSFTHFTSYGKLSILNLGLPSDAVVSTVTLTASKAWAGKFYYNDGEVSENSASSTITVNTASLTDIWFSCAPVDLQNSDLTITVTTSNGNYTKKVTFPAGKGNFQSGKVAKFSVDFEGIETDADVIYSIVKSASELTVGSKVIIASGNMALSTTQNSNNRGSTSVTVSEEQIKNPSDAVQILEIQKGSVDGTIALYTGEGYLYAASSSSNNLKTQENKDAEASFTVTFNGNDIALVAQGEHTRNTIKYNTANKIFSCYGTGQTEIQMYKLEGSGSDVPAISDESPEDPNPSQTTTVSFSPSDFDGQGTSSTGSSMSSTKTPITVSSDKGYGTTQIRSYAGSKLSITSSAGNIKSIKFTFSGTNTGGLNASYNNIESTEWSSNLASQARITAIEVEYYL